MISEDICFQIRVPLTNWVIYVGGNCKETRTFSNISVNVSATKSIGNNLGNYFLEFIIWKLSYNKIYMIDSNSILKIILQIYSHIFQITLFEVYEYLLVPL